MIEWKDIEGYENLYKISNDGRVESLPSEKGWGDFNALTKKGRILKPIKTRKGYLKYYLYKNGVRKGYYAHRLVAIAFLPNPLNLPQINHKNGNKMDNRVENLEWITLKDNIIHAYKVLKIKRKQNKL